MTMQPVRPSNKAPLYGLVLIFLLAIICAPLLGLAAAWIAHHVVYLVIASPIFLGLAGGLILMLGIRIGKMRNPTIALIFGILTGLILYGTYFYFDFLFTLQDERARIAAQTGVTDPVQANAEIDSMFQRETGSTGFMGFVKFTVQNGIVLISSYGPDSGSTITGVLVWIFWAVEVVFVVVICAGVARNASRFPFSETCNRWYSRPRPIGNIAPDVLNGFVQAVSVGDFKQARTLVGKRTKSSASLTAQSCPCKDADHIIKLEQRYRKGRTRMRRTWFNRYVTAAQFADLTGK